MMHNNAIAQVIRGALKIPIASAQCLKSSDMYQSCEYRLDVFCALVLILCTLVPKTTNQLYFMPWTDWTRRSIYLQYS